MSIENLSETAYKHISSMLMKYELMPGQKVSEPALAKALGISRTPVREAIKRLLNEGVLNQIPSSGTYVAQSDRISLIESYEVLLALETMAVRKVTERLRQRELIELKKCIDKMNTLITILENKKLDIIEGDLLTQFLSADFDFHHIIMKLARNRMALKLFTEAQLRNRIFGHISKHRDLQHAKETLSAHSEIVKAIEQRDADTAYNCIYSHIKLSLNEALEVLDDQFYEDNF